MYPLAPRLLEPDLQSEVIRAPDDVVHGGIREPAQVAHLPGFDVSEAAMAARRLKLTHPGKILREEFMEPIGLSAYALAKALDVPLPRVNDIVRAKRGISPEMAVLLSVYFGTSDSYWINLQGYYDLEVAKDRVGKHAARITPHPHNKAGALQPLE